VVVLVYIPTNAKTNMITGEESKIILRESYNTVLYIYIYMYTERDKKEIEKHRERLT
jgi:hypothetical protein